MDAIECMVTFLRRFGSVTDLGARQAIMQTDQGKMYLCGDRYHPLIAGQLRCNLWNQSIHKGGTVVGQDSPVLNQPKLWPYMLVKLYEDSDKIYYNQSNFNSKTEEEKEQAKKMQQENRCSTGMFLLLRELPLSNHQLEQKVLTVPKKKQKRTHAR